MRRRNLTILAGIGCLAVFVFGAATVRQEILTRYHLRRLRSDPEYLGKILSRSDGTEERAAVRRHLESEEGRLAFVRECLPKEFSHHVTTFNITYTLVCVDHDRKSVWLLFGGKARSLWYSPANEWFELTREYLMDGEEWILPEYPCVCFKLILDPKGWTGPLPSWLER